MLVIRVNPKSKITSSKQILNTKIQTGFRIRFKHLFLFAILYLEFGAWNLVLTRPQLALASTNLQSATVSATATIPTTPPVSSNLTAPVSPILIRPEDGTVTGDNHPEFVWHQSTDIDSNVVIYTLYLNGVATYLGITDTGNSSGAGYTARIETSDIRLLPTTDLPDGVYEWYVTASDLSGNTARSATWTLTIDTTTPPLTLVDLDIYHEPTLVQGTSFEIMGPKDIYFTLLSDPFVTIQISLSSLESNVYHLTSNTNPSGLAYLYQHLSPSSYSVIVTAIDAGGNTTALPEFTLTITQAVATITIPGLPPIIIPYTPYSLPSLPATIAQLQPISDNLPNIIYILLAVSILLLTIFLWRKKYNIIFLDYNNGQPLTNTKVYHSIPKLRATIYNLQSSERGRLYIPHLGRYSTLTICTVYLDICTTTVLSLSTSRRLYTMIL
ncbi:MAG: Ig-like domain-containing protein [bacterium]